MGNDGQTVSDVLLALDADMEENTEAERAARAEWMAQRDAILALLEEYKERDPVPNVEETVERCLAEAEEEKKAQERLKKGSVAVAVEVDEKEEEEEERVVSDDDEAGQLVTSEKAAAVATMVQLGGVNTVRSDSEMETPAATPV